MGSAPNRPLPTWLCVTSAGNAAPLRPISARYMHEKWKLMNKKIPTFANDRAAESFVDRADLSQYDLSGAQLLRFETRPKDKSINLRLPEALYNAGRTGEAHAPHPGRGGSGRSRK